MTLFSPCLWAPGTFSISHRPDRNASLTLGTQDTFGSNPLSRHSTLRSFGPPSTLDRLSLSSCSLQPKKDLEGHIHSYCPQTCPGSEDVTTRMGWLCSHLGQVRSPRESKEKDPVTSCVCPCFPPGFSTCGHLRREWRDSQGCWTLGGDGQAFRLEETTFFLRK